ncbi:MAG: M48 family metalloprotease [Planctomycetota bacterium]
MRRLEALLLRMELGATLSFRCLMDAGPTCRLRVMGGIALLLTGVVCGNASRTSTAADNLFSRDERRRIDTNALWSSREQLNPTAIEAAGSVLNWLILQTPLPEADQQRLALAAAEKARGERPWEPPPPAAAALFAKLAKNVPDGLRSPGVSWELFVARDLEPRSRLVGDRFLIVDRQWLLETLDAPGSGTEAVAFALAGELGHAVLGHARQRLQRQWLESELRRDAAERPVDQPKIEQLLDLLKAMNTILEPVYSREEEYRADLFALQLCRLAGFDGEKCLDGLRRDAIQDEPTLLDEPPQRDGIPPVEPERLKFRPGEEPPRAAPPRFVDRLRRLRLELDGTYYGPRWGLFEFDRQSANLRRVEDGQLEDGRPAIICVHGMESSSEAFIPMLKAFATDASLADRRLLTLEYPSDDSLARTGRFLRRELSRVRARIPRVDLVGHSAGGLVIRHFIELQGGEFHRAIFVATPHQGSDLAKLRRFLEASQFVTNLRLGEDEALRQAVVDGRGQITFDLQPNSLFLTELNRVAPGTQRDRYAIHRGLTRRPVLMLAGAMALNTARNEILASLPPSETTAARLGRSALELLSFPPEFTDGDMWVRTASADLPGVRSVQDWRLRHTELPRSPEVIAAIAQQLRSAP